MPEVRKQGGKLQGSAAVDANSVNAEARTFDVVFATETPVFRSPWWSDESFNEVLAIGTANIRTARLDTGGLPLLNNHNQWSGIEAQMGRVIEYSIDPAKKEARATIQFSSQERYAGTFQDIKDGIVRNISVGYRVWKYEQQPKGNAQDVKETPVYRAIDWEPLEISLVSVPADPNSSVRAEGDEKHTIEIIKIETQKRSGMNEDLKIQIRQAVTAAGLPESFAEELIGRGVTMDAATTEISARKAQGTPPVQAAPVATPAAPAVNAERAAELERERGIGIRTAVRNAKLPEAFADELISRKVDGKIITLDQARAAVIDKMADNDTNIAGPGGGAAVRSVDQRDTLNPMIEGLMERALPGSVRTFYNLPNEDGSKPATAGRGLSEAAQEFRHMRLIDVCRHLITKNGESARGMSDSDVVKRAMATSDMPNLFTSITNRFLRNNYETYVPEWLPFSREESATDFRVKTGIKVDANVTFEELAENGEYKSANILSDEKATIQLKTYARMFSIGRNTIINDDLSVLNRLPQLIALGARQFQSKKVWALITGNALCPDGKNLFHTDHKNFGTGASASVINDDSLSAARIAMLRQKSPEGNELMIVPKYLLVPIELQTKAEKLLRTISPTATDDVNIWSFLKPIVNPYFTDTKAWYVVADPNMGMVDGLVHSYLSGEKGLYTDSQVNFKNDALEIKARMDFAAAAWGHQGWYKNAGKDPSAD